MFWFISSTLDPRFKKLRFKNDRMLTDVARTRAIKWFTTEFNNNFKGKVTAHTLATNDAADGAQVPHHLKRRKTSAAGFFAASDDSDSEPDEQASTKDELKEYLALPQIKYKTEEDAMQWWRDNESVFPNLAVMARQYLGCPASSASVERLFSQVGIAFSAKRKSSEASTLESIMFALCNLP
jgi:hypothetical protein